MNLNDIMEFDHVVRVHADGTVTDEPNVYAPSLMDDELDSDRWEFVTMGYTGQDSYSGPIMHNSESIGGRLARDILAAPGVYVALVSYYSPEDDEDDEAETDAEGWAVVRLIETDDEREEVPHPAWMERQR